MSDSSIIEINGHGPRLPLPTCGTCDLAVQENDGLWCHGRPPACWAGENGCITSGFPPVRETTQGCALHPRLRRVIR